MNSNKEAVVELLRRFAADVNDVKMNPKEQIFQELTDFIDKKGLSENAVRGIVKLLLPAALLRYHEPPLRFLVLRFMGKLSTAYPQQAIPALTEGIVNILGNVKGSTLNFAKIALNGFKWIVVVLSKADVEASEQQFLSNLADALSVCLFVIRSAGSQKLDDSIRRKINQLCIKNLSVMEKLVATSLSTSDSVSHRHWCLIATVMEVWRKNHNQQMLGAYVPRALDLYVRTIFSAKTKPDVFILEACKPVLVAVDHDIFKQQLLPVVQKFMLRNAETIVEAVAYLLGQVPIDLSAYAMDLIKPLGTQLVSKDDLVREASILAIKNLAKQCSDQEVCADLIKYLFRVLNGSVEGKLTLVAQRISVLSAIGGLSFHGVSGAAAVFALCSLVVESFIPLLKEEANEATLIHALKILSAWTSRLSNEVPPALTMWFSEALRAKTTTSAVSFAYLQCMNISYCASNISAAKPLYPVLTSTIDKAVKQQPTQAAILEAFSASNLLLKLHPVLEDADVKLKPMFGAAIEKQLFTNEKFISGLREDGFLLLLDVTQRLLLYHADKFSETNAKSFYRALVCGLVHRAHSVRHRAISVVQKLLSSLGGISISKNLLAEFSSTLASGLLDKVATLETNEPVSKDEQVETNTNAPVKLLAEAVVHLVRVPDVEANEVDDLVVQALLALAAPRLAFCGCVAWFSVLKFYKRDVGSFITNNKERLLESIWNSPVQSCHIVNIIAKYCDQLFYSTVLSSIWRRTRVEQLNDVTLMEVEIMNTAEGVLYDRSVLQSKEEAPKANIKRESKLYSYKEQLAEIELRKELEEKWKREGKLKNELTPKQKEAMKQQLQKESEIRGRLRKLWQPVEEALCVLESLIDSNELLASQSIVEILDNLFPLFKSPLSAGKATQSWIRLGYACFSKEPLFGTAVAYATFRTAKIASPLDTWWSQEPLEDMIRRVLKHFAAKREKASYQNGSTDNEEETGTLDNLQFPISSSAFAYCFPLIRLTFEDYRSLFKDAQDLAADVVDSAAYYVGSASWDKQDFSVVCLPLENVASLSINTIGTTSAGALQQSACNCLLEVATTIEHFVSTMQKEIIVKVVRTILNGLFQPSGLVREYCLKAIGYLCNSLNAIGDAEMTNLLTQRLWVACFDVDEGNQGLAKQLWDKQGYTVSAWLCQELVHDAIHHTEAIREAASSAICSALEQHQAEIKNVLDKLCSLYIDKLEMIPPGYDDFGRLISEGSVDQWEARAGVALTLKKLCPLLTEKNIRQYFDIMLPDGLNDRSKEVRNLMLSAAIAGVKEHGDEQIGCLLPMFEKQLDDLPSDKQHDILRQSLVVLLGTLAQHLKPDDPKVRPIVAKLVEALSTPSEQVQEAVAQCLPPLIPSIKEQLPQMIEKLLCLLLDADQYGERRGAAYGLAGLVKGSGILSLKQFEIMAKLNAAISDKKSARHREGALLAIEMLCNMLGKLFEPYVVQILPSLLLCFGDNDEHVREAADDCAKAVMRHLSAHGVKLVLPSLLTGLEEDSWRTKCGSVELLAAMSYCAPKQLSSCLPNIVPKLIEVLSDTHLRVQKAGEHALRQIGQVIKNPEIQAVVNVLLGALEDPSKKTATCLQTLLHTRFVHYIDSPSLALIMPVLYRAFDDRSTETRRIAAQIVGNIYSLTDQKDVEPYLARIMPGLKKCLLDPVPEVRAVAARALGAMVKATGESCFQDLVPWLQQTLITPAGSVDRAGAAQGLSEVIGGLGEQQLARVMPEIIQAAESPEVEPHVRDGYIMMYIFLPTVFGEKFLPYLSKIIPSILKALADESEYVRETALRAGQRIINTYCETAIPLLLPSLERGLFDDNWRIRLSSVQLLGDLLFKISGVTGKMSAEGSEDDTFGTESASKAVTRALGVERRNRVLAGLYIARSDVALMVRQSAGHIWKVVVSNTPRTLKEILQDLFTLLLGCLASSNYDKQQVASRSLGELVRKMGERILVDVVPVLEHGLKSEQADQRRGVCIALSAIVTNISKEMVLMYAENLIPTARMALCDPLPEVRDAAAATFSALHNAIGPQAMDEILTPLLERLADPSTGPFALDGLKLVLKLKSKVILPHVIPKLTAPPVNTKALAQLASVAGESLTKHLNKILSALLVSFASALGTPNEEEEKRNCSIVLLAVPDETGVSIVVDMLLQKASESDRSMKRAASILLADFCQNTKGDLGPHIQQLLKGLIFSLAFDDDIVLSSSTDAVNALIKGMASKEQIELVQTIRAALKSAVEELRSGSQLPGFRRDKTLQPLLTVLREGVLNGSPDAKEISAYGLSEIVNVSDPTALKPHAVNVTGPLIRILGDRYPPNIKTALLSTLALLLSKIGIALKAFLPQLQSTFVKALNEPSSKSVRLKAGQALAELARIHPKADSLTADVCKNAKAAEDHALKETYLVALRLMICAAGTNLTMETKSAAEAVSVSLVGASDEPCRIAAGAALGALVAHAMDVEADAVLRHLFNTDASQEWTLRHGNSIALLVALKENSSKFESHREMVINALLGYISSDRVPICSSGLRAAGYYLRHQLSINDLDQRLSTAVARAINHQSNDIKLLSALVSDYLSQRTELNVVQLKLFVPSMVNGTKEKNSAVRAACEFALVNLLKLRRDGSTYNSYLESLDTGARDSLADVYTKTLLKLSKQQQDTVFRELDDTLVL